MTKTKDFICMPSISLEKGHQIIQSPRLSCLASLWVCRPPTSFLICNESSFSNASHVSEPSKFCLLILHFMNFRNSCQTITHSVCYALLWKADYVFPLCICSVCGVLCEFKRTHLGVREDPQLSLQESYCLVQTKWVLTSIFRQSNTIHHMAPPCGLKVEPALRCDPWPSWSLYPAERHLSSSLLSPTLLLFPPYYYQRRLYRRAPISNSVAGKLIPK